MPESILAQRVLLPELELQHFYRHKLRMFLHARKRCEFEVCPKCATPSSSGYDKRTVRVKDAPLRNTAVTLVITKRRLYCKPCRKPFTEPLAGVRKGRRSTERYRSYVLWACENFTNLESVRRSARCSAGFLHNALYEQLDLRLRKRQNPWPVTIGIDEHSFRRNKKLGRTEFASIIVDYKNRRVKELVEGRTSAELQRALAHIEGKENVQNVILDMCDPFKNFAVAFFPNARIIADKFHVLRLLTPHINRRRKALVGDRRTAKIGRLLLKNGPSLDYFTRRAVWDWLAQYPELKDLYSWKERMHGFYRTRGYDRAATALTAMTDELANSQIKELKTLRRTLMKWRIEILAYFQTGLTNGRTEGFNNLAKLVQRRAFGYKSFRNYRLRLLNACA
jgi:transposase